MSGAITLRDATADDLPIFFEQQRDPAANHMAAFTAKDPADRAAYLARWSRILGDTSVIHKAIVRGGQVVGSIGAYEADGHREVTYWIDKEFWGQGIATQALTALLRVVRTRPLYGRAAKDNLASLRVLQACGFVIIGEDRGYANARGTEIEEVLLRLDTPADPPLDSTPEAPPRAGV